MDDATFKKLTVLSNVTKNILIVDIPEMGDEGSTIAIADQKIRSFAQNLIDGVGEHRHLQAASILFFCGHKDSEAKKLKKGQRIKAGSAAKADTHTRFLSQLFRGKKYIADWIVTISGDWLDAIKDADDRDRRLLALIDHKLLHCGAKITGEFVPDHLLKSFVEDLGKQFIETCEDIRNEDDEPLVRYYDVDAAGNYQPTLRKHDVEEFEGVAERHGTWDRQLGRLVDSLKKSEKTLFDQKAAG